ncbi:flagellar basal-body rod protein FlgF [Chitinibacter bivalviorum]|uniref:Flagellar basal-body rod protein FlgF n=1 Tax=Chitinibacter bivalviorum TaxID=2739434 RepID=A0A7H9BIM1_9NEIS|nr:flagellar basal-body rod protein FlgF [Chitinibacter bivalviorum]QLG88136.1 flagellar basal-body rod protein FlgF [Chitinibacter bivalviorum]
MDRLIYVAMSGAKNSELRQATIANNLANVTTPGFRAELAAARAVPALGGPGLGTRAYVLQQTPGADMSPGVFQQTGRDLDVAVKGQGWLTIQTPTGEAYTRNGSFQIDSAGLLKTGAGEIVQGENGPLTIPENNRASIGIDGTVTAIDVQNPTQSVEVGKLKLVNPANDQLEKGLDGLFRLRSGEPAQTDPAVQLASGGIEGSNVNSVEQLVNMISTQRHFDLQVKLLQTAEQNSRSASSIMSLNG